MKRIINYFIIVYVLLFIPLNTVFAECSDKEKMLYRDNESKFSITYEFNRSNESYTLIFNNPYPDIFGFQMMIPDNLNCDTSNPNAKKCSYFGVGSYAVQIVGKTNTCNDTFLDFILELPYNEYYLDKECAGIEDFILCSPSYDKDISYEDFLYRVKLYKEEHKEEEKKVEEKPVVKENKFLTVINNIWTFIKNNALIVGSVIAGVILLIILINILYKRYKRRWRLE